MYHLEVRESANKIFKKLAKKDKVSFEYINKKIKEIIGNPYRFKPLKVPMQNFRRVHVGSYVLVYSKNEEEKVVVIERYKHHDEVYQV